MTSHAVHVVGSAHVDAALPRRDVVEHDGTGAQVADALPATQHVVAAK